MNFQHRGTHSGVEKPLSTNVLLLSHSHQTLIASSKPVAFPCRACTLSMELDFGVALTPVCYEAQVIFDLKNLVTE